MKIEVKNIKINKMFSEETICFKADVYINGKKIAYAENDGHGGSTFYNAYDMNGREILRQAEEYTKTLPSVKFEIGDRVHEIPMNLELFIDEKINDTFNKKEKAKEDKKMNKLMETSIVYGVPNGVRYKYISFKNNTIAQLMSNHTGRIVLENTINRIKKELKDGEVIFNTNLF